MLCEMQSVRFRIWTRVAVSLSCDDNHYTTGTSLLSVRNELETRTDCNINPSSPLDHSSISFTSWLGVAQLLVTEGRKAPSLQVDSHAGILFPTGSNRLGTWLYYCLRPPASAVLLLIYKGASPDWRLGWGSIYNTHSYIHIGHLG